MVVLKVDTGKKTYFVYPHYAQKLYRVNVPLATPYTGYGSPAPKKADNLDPDSLRYHQEFHANFQAFKRRKWQPLSAESVAKPSVQRCRPISARPATSDHSDTFDGALVPRPPSAPRPHSVPINGHQPQGHLLVTPDYLRRPDTPRVTHGFYDTLSPRILCHLVTDPRPLTPLSSYGDVLGLQDKPRRKKKKRKQTSRTLALLKGEEFNSSNCDSSDSNDEDIDGDNIDDDDDDSEDSSDDDDSDNESTSELERGFEPAVDRFRQVPDLRLRPEKLDHVYMPENKRDMRRFDFDAEKVDIPPYEFETPIPHPFNLINLRLHAREDTNWRFASVNLAPEDPELGRMLDRLVEIEKIQIETEEWEEKKAKVGRGRRPPSRSSGAGGSAGFRIRDKRCCNSCLQAACVGDCPNKRPPPVNCCEKCHQLLCRGNCTDTRYNQHMRHAREPTVAPLPPRPAVPKNCRTCQRKHTAKYINANNAVLGRPKSAFSTFSRGQFSTKPKDLRPTSAQDVVSVSAISQRVERLGLDYVQPSPPPPKTSRPSSRNGIIPGKSYFSNLNDSLTDLTSASFSAKRRVKSARTRRARSAHGCKSQVQNGL